jgi:hypothetical protein
MTQLCIAHYRDHGKQAGKSNQAKTINQRAPTRYGAGKADTQRSYQRDSHCGGRYSARIISQCDDGTWRKIGLKNHEHITGNDVVVQRGARHDTKTSQGNSDPNPDRDRDTQSPDANCACRYITGLDRYRNQCRFSHRGSKTNGRRKDINPVIILPAYRNRRAPE